MGRLIKLTSSVLYSYGFDEIPGWAKNRLPGLSCENPILNTLTLPTGEKALFCKQALTILAHSLTILTDFKDGDRDSSDRSCGVAGKIWV
jgi:hypothetical protein